MIYRPGCRNREPTVPAQTNPATQLADNLIALELIQPAPAVRSKRYALPWFARQVELHEAAITRHRCAWCGVGRCPHRMDPS